MASFHSGSRRKSSEFCPRCLIKSGVTSFAESSCPSKTQGLIFKPLIFFCTLARVSSPSHNFKYHLYPEYLTFDPSDLSTEPSTLLTNCPTQCLIRISKRHLKLDVAQTEILTYLTPVQICFPISHPQFSKKYLYASICLDENII